MYVLYLLMQNKTLPCATYVLSFAKLYSWTLFAARTLFTARSKKAVVVQMLESLSEDQCIHVLRATPVHRLHDFSTRFQRLALKAHYSSVESSKSLDVKLTDPKTTLQVSNCLASLTMLTSLSFKPWLDDHATREAFKTIQILPQLVSLDVGGMHLSAAACSALAESLLVRCSCKHVYALSFLADMSTTMLCRRASTPYRGIHRPECRVSCRA